MNPVYPIGVYVRVNAVFLDSLGVNTLDPDVVLFEYEAEALAITTTRTYGASALLVRDGVGRYHSYIDTRESSGNIYWRFYSTGNGQAADEGVFYVRPRQF
jgi:hypothetical protein